MQVEILIGNDNLSVYSLTNAKTLIGSDSNCDIVLSVSDVSRRHLLITIEAGNYFVSDQGSTNGSYLNEERMVPGRRHEFTTYFPVRLGSSVLVSLVNDTTSPEDVSVKATNNVTDRSEIPEEKTRVVSLKELKKTKTSHLVQKKNTLKSSKQKTSVTKKKSKLNSTHLFAFFIIAIAGFFTYRNRQEKLQQKELKQIKQSNVQENSPPVIKEKIVLDMPKDTVSKIMSYLALPKCTTEREKVICKSIKGVDESKWGAIENNEGIFILLDGSSYYEEAKKYLYPPPEVKISKVARERKFNEKDIWEVAAAFFIVHEVENKLDIKENENPKLKFAFFRGQDEIKLQSLLEIDLRGLNAVKSILNAHRLEYIPEEGIKPIKFALEYYQLSTTK